MTSAEPQVISESFDKNVKAPVKAAAESAADSVEETASSTASSVSSSNTSKVFAHLQEYPTFSAAYNYATSHPIAQKAASYTLPYVEAAKERGQPIISRATPVLAKADALGDRVLTSVDSRFTSLKTTQPEDVYDLAKKPVETIRSTADAYKAAANERVVKPLHARAESVSSKVVDPLLKPVNERLETAINTYLPASEKTETSSEGVVVAPSKYELARTYSLTRTAVERARPVLVSQASATRAHVQDVYNTKHSEYAKGTTGGVQTTVYASIATARQLSNESVALVGSALQKQ